MKQEEFNTALNYIDYDLVEEFVEEKGRVNQKSITRKNFISLVPIAASLVVVLCMGTIIVPTILGGASNNKPTLPEDSLTEVQKPESLTTTVPPTTTVPNLEDPPAEDHIPPSDSTEDEGGMKPEGDVEIEDACPYAYNFTVIFEGEVYICCFGAPDETDYDDALYKYQVDASLVGEYIGMASGKDPSGFLRQFKIYKLLGDTDRDIIIEIEEGYFFIATK